VRVLRIERKIRFKVTSEDDEIAHTLRKCPLDLAEGLLIVFLDLPFAVTVRYLKILIVTYKTSVFKKKIISPLLMV